MTAVTIDLLEKRIAEETVEQARRAFGLNFVEVASVLGVDRRTVFRYRKHQSVPSRTVQARMEKIREIAHLMGEVFNGRETELEWLYTPVSMLRGRRPVDLLREGELDQVLAVLAGAYSGAMS